MRRRISLASVATRLFLAGIAPLASVSAQQPAMGGVIAVVSQEPNGPTGPAAPTIANADAPPLLSNETAATPRMWFGGESILWFNSSASSPRLAILGPPPTLNAPANMPLTPIPTAPGFVGLLSFGNVYRYGVDNAVGSAFDSDVPGNTGIGGRFTFGAWFSDDATFGIEGRYLVLSRTTDGNTGGPAAALGLAYVNALTGAPSAYAINQGSAITAQSTTFVNTTPDTFVGLFTTTSTEADSGRLSIRSTSQLQGGELNGVWCLGRAANWHAEATAGVRFIEYDEILAIDSLVNETHTDMIVYRPELGLPAPTGTPVFNSIASKTDRSDRFETRNTFYGGEVGLRSEYGWGRFSISVDGDASVGYMHETLSISGATNATIASTLTPTKTTLLAGIPITTNTGGPVTTTTTTSIRPGGFYAQPTNIGHYSRDAFAVVPEGILKFSYRFTDRLSGNVGYTVLYLSDAARAGEQVNPVINPTFLTSSTATGPAQPSGRIVGSDVWVQGVSFGLELKY